MDDFGDFGGFDDDAGVAEVGGGADADMNGFQATRQIARGADTKHIPIIIVSGKGQETDKVWGQRQGAKGYLTKPVATNDLISAMQAYL